RIAISAPRQGRGGPARTRARLRMLHPALVEPGGPRPRPNRVGQLFVAMSEASNHPGKSPHAFMREALGVQARLREDRHALVRAAAAPLAHTVESGKGSPALDVDRHFATRAAHLPASAPEPHALAGVMYAADAFADLERIYAGLEA